MLGESFEQIPMVIEEGKKHGLMKSYPLVFIKNYSSQVLKANMKIVGATEYGVVRSIYFFLYINAFL